MGGEDGVSATAGQRLVYPALSQLQRQPITQPQVQVQGPSSRLVAISGQKNIRCIAITKQWDISLVASTEQSSRTLV